MQKEVRGAALVVECTSGLFRLCLVALSKINFSYLHYSVIQYGRESFLDRKTKLSL